MIEAMIQMTAVGFVAAVLGTVLRRHTPELALLLALCAGLWMLRPAAEGLRAVVAVMEELAQLSGLSEELLEPVAKAVALSVFTRLAAEICRGAGEGGVAAFLELTGTVLTLVVALPLVRAVTILMAEILG